MQLANITHILCSANQQPLCMYVLAVQGPLLTRRFAKMQSHTVVRRFMVKDEFIQMMRFHHNVTFPEAERLWFQLLDEPDRPKQVDAQGQ